MKPRHRQILATGAVVATVAVFVGLMMLLSPADRALWFGKTVDHCPDSDLSCPSTKPGLFFIVWVVAIPLAWWADNRGTTGDGDE